MQPWPGPLSVETVANVKCSPFRQVFITFWRFRSTPILTWPNTLIRFAIDRLLSHLQAVLLIAADKHAIQERFSPFGCRNCDHPERHPSRRIPRFDDILLTASGHQPDLQVWAVPWLWQQTSTHHPTRFRSTRVCFSSSEPESRQLTDRAHGLGAVGIRPGLFEPARRLRLPGKAGQVWLAYSQ